MAKIDRTKDLTLRRMGESLYLTVPKDFVRAHNLQPDADVTWIPEPNGVRLVFDRAPASHQPAPHQQSSSFDTGTSSSNQAA